MSPGPMADNAPSEGFVVPLSESQYAVLFYCLDILIDSQDVMLSPDMAADVLDIRYQLSSNLLHEDQNKLEWAERLAGDYLRDWDMRNPLLRRDGITRAEAYMEAAMSFEDLRKDIEYFSKVNDWKRVHQAALNKLANCSVFLQRMV